MSTTTQSVHIVSDAEYLPLRLDLLKREKEHTRANDALSAARRALPIVEVTKPYSFIWAGPDGTDPETTHSLLDIFRGRRQLVLQHFMFGPDWDAGCHACSLTADGFGVLEHFNARSTTIACVSRAPIAKINAYKKRMGWTFPWYSTYQNDFSYDFADPPQLLPNQTLTPAQLSTNYMSDAQLAAKGLDYARVGDETGVSCFIQGNGADIGEIGKVYHTYSGYRRQMEKMNTFASVMDLTFLGRQDGGKDAPPKDKRKDEYTDEDLNQGW